MRLDIQTSINSYLKLFFSFCISFTLVRVYEYIVIASKSFLPHSYLFEVWGAFYDLMACYIIGLVFLVPFLLISCIHQKAGNVFIKTIHVILIMVYIALIITFSERNIPFDHEFFTRSFRESLLTTQQMLTSGFYVYVPFIVFVGLYFLAYYFCIKPLAIHKKAARVIFLLMILSTAFIAYAVPRPTLFEKKAAYYLTSNKFSFWLKDTYVYFKNKNKFDASRLTRAELNEEINLYQANQPFQFVSKEYPLLHENNEPDVLGSFFNFKSTPPNIVILVVEGLSRDFSGANAFATSFTPFLDSLSNHSLVWDNFLSTAPGTFAAHPAISGSLPYGQRGFSAMNIMPDHLSLIKILRKNGYHAKFLIGFNPDFDNMGGYIRAQGTDFLLSHYPGKYKEMGIGEEGWSMGYPDDALYARSFEVMDSIKNKPYLNIYHTGTTHMPYLFEQKKEYEKKFDEKLKTLVVKPEIKKILKETRKVLVTFMFSDDCLREFFKKYAQRPEFGNTIFFITGDHHIGSFPSTCGIDDYHVPFIVYSPLLKSPGKFLSVNSHNNIAPTISNMLLQNFKFPYKPKEVHWLGSVMDTAVTFRNIHNMPFMWWSREIADYIHDKYYLTGEQLYELTPELLEKPVENDSIRNYMIRLRDNYKLINSYVCTNNKIFPASQKDMLPGEKTLLFDFKDTAEKKIFANSSDTSLMQLFKIPKGYDYLFVETAADIFSPMNELDHHPSLRMALIDIPKITIKDYVYWTNRELIGLSKQDFIPQQWNTVSATDLFTLNDYKDKKNLLFELGIYSDIVPINFNIRNMNVKIYGIRKQ